MFTQDILAQRAHVEFRYRKRPEGWAGICRHMASSSLLTLLTILARPFSLRHHLFPTPKVPVLSRMDRQHLQPLIEMSLLLEALAWPRPLPALALALAADSFIVH